MVISQALYFRRRLANTVFITLSMGAACSAWCGWALSCGAVVQRYRRPVADALYRTDPAAGQRRWPQQCHCRQRDDEPGRGAAGHAIGLFAGTYLAEYARFGKLAFVVRFVNDICCRRPPSSPACSSMKSSWSIWAIFRASPASPPDGDCDPGVVRTTEIC